MSGPPPLSEEQLQELLAKKKAYAASKGEEGNACQNDKCRCGECTCGAGCTCNISPEVNCDECKDFKAKMAAKMANGEKLNMAQDMWNEKIAPRFVDVPVITTAEILELHKESADSVLLVDCRPEVERAVSTIPGAVPLDVFEADLEKLSEGKVVAPFCTIGGRSAPVVQRLMERPEKPWKEMKNYELSCIGWAHSGSQFEDPEGKPTNKFFVPAPGLVSMFPAGYEVLVPES